MTAFGFMPLGVRRSGSRLGQFAPISSAMEERHPATGLNIPTAASSTLDLRPLRHSEAHESAEAPPPAPSSSSKTGWYIAGAVLLTLGTGVVIASRHRSVG